MNDPKLIVIEPGRGASVELAEDLRRRLKESGAQAGDRFPTVRTLMEQYRLGYGTVIRAVQLLAEDGFVEQRQGSGTFVRRTTATATALGRPGTKRIGVVPPFWAQSIASHTVGAIFHGISAHADRSQWRVEVVHNHGVEAAGFDFVDKIRSLELDGLIWMQPVPAHEVNLARLIDRGLPVVTTGRRFARLPLSTVHEDIALTGQLVAEHLTSHGRRKLLVLSGPQTDAYNSDRIAAVRKSVEAISLALPDDQIALAHWPDLPLASQWLLDDSVRQIVERHADFDAIFATHATHLHTLVKLHAAGEKVSGRDYSMISMNQHAEHVRRLWPSLPMATLDWPLQAIGREAVRVLGQSWQADSPPENLSPTLDAQL